MDLSVFGVRATAGTLRAADGVVLRHTWTDKGVVAEPATNGAQLLHLSVALCILNDAYREAEKLGIKVDGIVVTVDGGFDDDWRSLGIDYSIKLEAEASDAERAALLELVHEVAEIPRALRAGATVTRVD